jgi:hypothetical protein
MEQPGPERMECKQNMEKRGKHFSHSKTLVCLAELYVFKEARTTCENK